VSSDKIEKVFCPCVSAERGKALGMYSEQRGSGQPFRAKAMASNEQSLAIGCEMPFGFLFIKAICETKGIYDEACTARQ